MAVQAETKPVCKIFLKTIGLIRPRMASLISQRLSIEYFSAPYLLALIIL